MSAATAIGRSLRIYYGDPARAGALDTLYGPFLRPGDLAFDIGAHVGDRTASFRRLGARVVALEPQPACFRALRLIHGRDADVTLVRAAAGRRPRRGAAFRQQRQPDGLDRVVGLRRCSGGRGGLGRPVPGTGRSSSPASISAA